MAGNEYIYMYSFVARQYAHARVQTSEHCNLFVLFSYILM